MTEKIIWDRDDADYARTEDPPEGFTCVKSADQIDSDRWQAHYEAIFCRIEDKTFWRLQWQRGLTEMQDCDSFYGENPVELNRVWPKETMMTIYVDKDPAAWAE